MGSYVYPTTDKADPDSLARCKRVLELMLTNRGNPSSEVERVLSEDPELVFGHCLRAALIVRADDFTARSKVVASVTAIETICPDIRPSRSNVMAPSSSTARVTYSRLWLRMHLTSASDSGACCEIALLR